MVVKISKNRLDMGSTPIQNVSSQDFNQIATPAAPPASKTRVYSKTDGTLYRIVNAGSEIAVVETTSTQTLSAKTLTKPTVNASVQGTQTYTPAAAGTATLDLSLANINLITMPAGNITIALSSGSTGQVFTVHITQDSVGSRTVTWFTTIKWAGGSAPTLTTTASKRDVLGFIITGTNTYDGFVVGANL